VLQPCTSAPVQPQQLPNSRMAWGVGGRRVQPSLSTLSGSDSNNGHFTGGNQACLQEGKTFRTKSVGTGEQLILRNFCSWVKL